ncbi:MAG: hypothetical protein NVS2B11_07890 [Acetobacteraceae bacterium]
MKRRARWFADRRGATAVEFAMIASVFVPLCLTGLDAGVLLWTKGVLQYTAANVARCAAISSSACPDVGKAAVTLAGNWSFPGIIAAADVVGPTLVCVAPTQLAKVTITSTHWANAIIPALSGSTTLTAVAYFPTATGC